MSAGPLHLTSPASGGGRRTCGSLLLVTVGCALACLVSVASAEIPLDQRRSGYADLGPETKAMQDDDTANPGMLSVLDGEALWKQKAGEANRACIDCHGDARTTMKGVAARYPAFEAKLGRPVNLDQRINLCRTEQQKATPFAYESKPLLALGAYIGLQSRGQPIAPPDDARLAPFREAGREAFNRRMGQLNLSCAQCHDDNWGKRLAGSLVPQAHPNGYPLYRLEWQSIGSLQRRLRNCMIGMRAEHYDYGAPEYIAMELFLMWRARGLPIETPAVRP
jgi:L-cysteine S-thiosulfotransferase